MPRKTGSLRGPAPEPNSFRAVSADLSRFAKSNLRDPDKALAALRASSPSPDRLPVTTSDLIRQSGRDPIQPSDVVRRDLRWPRSRTVPFSGLSAAVATVPRRWPPLRRMSAPRHPRRSSTRRPVRVRQ